MLAASPVLCAQVQWLRARIEGMLSKLETRRKTLDSMDGISAPRACEAIGSFPWTFASESDRTGTVVSAYPEEQAWLQPCSAVVSADPLRLVSRGELDDLMEWLSTCLKFVDPWNKFVPNDPTVLYDGPCMSLSVQELQKQQHHS